MAPNHKNTITKFYTAFAKSDHQQMAACYHEDIIFEDPAFGQLKGERASKMWEMLLSNKSSSPEITHFNICLLYTSPSPRDRG